MRGTQPSDTHAPFDRDVREAGAYRYTDGARLSTRIANERYSDVILSAADFAQKRVVDVGAGDGTYTAELAHRSTARSLLGIEPSPEASRHAALTYGTLAPRVEFRCGLAADLLREGQQFDIAVYRGVIHHVPDPRAELYVAMRLAALVVMLEPNGLNPLMKAVERVSRYHREHLERSYNPFTTARWIREAGGEPVALTPFGLVPYFCPDFAAKAGRCLEPLVESLPFARLGVCGQYLIVARGRPA